MRFVDFFDARSDDEARMETYHALDWNYMHWPYMYENDMNRDALVRVCMIEEKLNTDNQTNSLSTT